MRTGAAACTVAVAFLLAAVALAAGVIDVALGARTFGPGVVDAAELVVPDDIEAPPPRGSETRSPPSRMNRPMTAAMVLTARSELRT